MPCAAFGLKQYFCRSGRVSKTSDNDDATASLGDSEVLSVQHSVGEAIPAFPQAPEDGTHPPAVECHASPWAGEPMVVSSSGCSSAGASSNSVRAAGTGRVRADRPSRARADARQETGDVLQDEPPGPNAEEEAKDLSDEARACSTQSEAKTRQGEIGARPPSAEDAVNRAESCGKDVIGRYLRDVAEGLGLGEMIGCHTGRRLVDLDRDGRADARRRERSREPADPVEQADQLILVLAARAGGTLDVGADHASSLQK
jgi:hypothetical protein